MSNSGVNPTITNRMTGLLERTRSRRTFTKDSFTSPLAPPAPKIEDVQAENAKLKAEVESAVQNSKHAEKGKLEAERVAQEHALNGTKDKDAAEAARAERDEALKEAESARQALGEAETKVEQIRLAMEKLQEEMRDAERRANEKVQQAEADRAAAEEASHTALIEAESARQALEHALMLTEQYRTDRESLAKEMRETERVSRETLERAEMEAESSKAALSEVERRVGDERKAREYAERELKKRNEEPTPHTIFGYAMSTFSAKSREVREAASSRSQGSSSSWSNCVIA